VVVVDVQVGEESDGAPARVTPLALTAGVAGAAASAPLTAVVPVVSSAAPTPGAPSEPAQPTVGPPARDDDTLAPGTRLGFADDQSALADSGPRSDEFFVGAASASVPVARSTTRVPPPPPADPVPLKESRRERRRRLGIPRPVTFRVLGFLLLVAAVFAGAYYALRWYAYDNWIATVKGNQVVVIQGQKGGVLWFHPKVVDRTGKQIGQVDPSSWKALQGGVSFPSLAAAKSYIDTIGTTTTTTTTTSTTGPTTVQPQNSGGAVTPSSSTTTSQATTVPTSANGAP